MSRARISRAERKLGNNAPLFAALGDETRISLLTKLGQGSPQSISSLAEGTDITRQAIRKHLDILEQVDLVRSVMRGRENLFQLNSKPINDLRISLEEISLHWDNALIRLKNFVE